MGGAVRDLGTITSILASERLEKYTYLASGLDWIVTEHACIENTGAVLDFLCLSCKKVKSTFTSIILTKSSYAGKATLFQQTYINDRSAAGS